MGEGLRDASTENDEDETDDGVLFRDEGTYER